MVDNICWMVDVGDGLFGTKLSLVHLLAGIRRSIINHCLFINTFFGVSTAALGEFASQP